MGAQYHLDKDRCQGRLQRSAEYYGPLYADFELLDCLWQDDVLQEIVKQRPTIGQSRGIKDVEAAWVRLQILLYQVAQSRDNPNAEAPFEQLQIALQEMKRKLISNYESSIREFLNLEASIP